MPRDSGNLGLLPFGGWYVHVNCLLLLIYSIAPVACLPALKSCVYLQDTASKPAGDAVVAAEAPADNQTQGNQASVHLHSDAQKEALDRQINPRGDPTPMELPPQAQQEADAPSADEAALEGDDSPSGTADHSSTKEVTAPQDDTPPSEPAPVEVAEGAGAKEGADADTATITASADSGASDAPSPSGLGLEQGVPEAALEGEGAPPKGESTPVEVPAEPEKPAQARPQWHVSMLCPL